MLGLIVRLAVFSQTSELDVRIVDEQHYTAIADNIAGGYGFGWGPNDLTSIRPPLFPGLVSVVWRVFGVHNFQAVRLLNVVLATMTSLVVFALGRRTFNGRVGWLAAVATWLYPSLVFFNFTVLTETLFTLLLMVFLLSAVALVQTPRPGNAIMCGVALGLAALTRSVLWPVPLIFCPLLIVLLRIRWRQRLGLSALVLAGYALVITPWAVRNTRLQEVVTIVDTMGGINLRMGNYEYTPDDRMWDAVAQTGQRSWVYGFSSENPGLRGTEGQKDKWAQRKALDYMKTHPATTLRRAAIKFGDFWGLEREFLAGVTSGLFQPPRWVQISGSLIIVLAYVAVALTGAAGAWLGQATDWRLNVVLFLPVVVLTGAHTLVFGHSRYHLPLIPILLLYSARWLDLGLPIRGSGRAAWAAGFSVFVLIAIWGREVLVEESDRLLNALHRLI